MPYVLPIRVRERLMRTELIDANGQVIAMSPPKQDWHGSPLERCPEFIKENFSAIANKLNSETR